MRRTRRKLLSGGVAVMAAIAGCGSTLGEDDSEEETQTPRYQALRSTPIYLGARLDVDLSAYARVVDDPTESVIALVHPETDVSGDTLVEWLRSDVAVGLLGSPAMEQLSEFLQDGGVTDHFEGGYIGTSGTVDLAVVVPEKGNLLTMYADGINMLQKDQETADALNIFLMKSFPDV